MTIDPGTRLGPYEILAPIGAGGMGEVFRAKDTRLDRSVAIKVLPSHLSSDPRFRERFDREARAVSALNHPHICTLHDVGHHDGIDYIVMELVEGETLADRLTKGPLPLEQVLRYGAQIADALDKAHRQGIVHRDLKPGNIMITKSGTKLLDFGLAKTLTALSAVSGLTNQPTEHKPLTQEGTILGTFQYMAPEQLEGEEADARTDIFAFGCVLYEMVTGRRAFEGKTKTSLIAAIVSGEPHPVSQIQPLTPPALEHVIKKCLAKERDDRLQSAHDIAEELQWIHGSGTPASLRNADASVRRLRVAFGVVVAFLVVALTVAAIAIIRGQRTDPASPPLRTSIVLPEVTRLQTFALSPDGRWVTLVASDQSGVERLWIRPMDSLELRPLATTEGASYPFWSPDSQWIGFFANGKLRKINASGGPSRILCDARNGRGGAWNPDGVILFSPGGQGGLYRIAASGGDKPVEVTSPDRSKGESTHRWPLFLPDGRHFLYLRSSFGSGPKRPEFGVYVGSLDQSSPPQLLVSTNSNFTYANGFVLYGGENTLYAQRFDLETRGLGGEPAVVAEHIRYFPQVYWTQFSASSNGILLYQSLNGSPGSQLVWFDTTGKVLQETPIRGFLANPSLSPDGKQIAAQVTDARASNSDIWIYAADGSNSRRMTFGSGDDSGPVWSPDGLQLVFGAHRDGRSAPALMNVDTAGQHDFILGKYSSAGDVVTDIHRDGKTFLIRAFSPGGTFDLVLGHLDRRTGSPIIATEAGELDGRFSPTGKLLAYVSDESGHPEVYLTRFPAATGKWQVSTSGGIEPIWRKDGGQLFFLTGSKELMVADIKSAENIQISAPRRLFKTALADKISGTDIGTYDVSPEGDKFLMNIDRTAAGTQTLTVVLNWSSGMKP